MQLPNDTNFSHFNKHLRNALFDIIETSNSDKLDNSLKSFHAAIIVSGGKVIGKGRNKTFNTGFVRAFAHHNWCNEHAEINAISRCRKKIDLTGARLYVARIDKQGIISNSKPCNMCQTAMRQYGIKRVYYTVDAVTSASMKL